MQDEVRTIRMWLHNEEPKKTVDYDLYWMYSLR